MLRALAIAFLCLAGRVTSVRAQITVELGPRYGVFGAGNHLVERFVEGFCQDCLIDTATIGYGHQMSLAFGGDLSAWLAERWALEFSAEYASSEIGTVVPFQAAHIGYFGVRALRDFPIAQGPLSFDLSLGVGEAKRGGTFYRQFAGTNTVTEVAGVGLRLKTGPWTVLRAELEDNHSNLRLAPVSSTVGWIPASHSQNDWIFSFGFAVNIGGRLKGPFF